VGRHQAFEFFKPVEDDKYFRRYQFLLTLDHQEPLAIEGDLAHAAFTDFSQDFIMADAGPDQDSPTLQEQDLQLILAGEGVPGQRESPSKKRRVDP